MLRYCMLSSTKITHALGRLCACRMASTFRKVSDCAACEAAAYLVYLQ